MNKTLTVVFALLMYGCASRTPTTGDFYKQEQTAAQSCMAASKALPPGASLVVDPKTGRSPNTHGAICYASQIRFAAEMTKYKNAGIVEQYARYTVDLAEARDKGMITQQAALASHAQAVALFQQAIVRADDQRAAVARTELADKLAIFAAAYANASAEQQRQQQLNRPVVCTFNGVYRTTGIVCN